MHFLWESNVILIIRVGLSSMSVKIHHSISIPYNRLEMRPILEMSPK